MDEEKKELVIEEDRVEETAQGDGADDSQRAWIADAVGREVERLRAMTVRAIPFRVAQCGVVRLGASRGDVVNRVELRSAYNFDAIGQLMHSEPIAFPFRPGFRFVIVVMFPHGSRFGRHPLLFPYVYRHALQDPPTENSLDQWLLINNTGHRTRLSVSRLQSVR